MRWMSRWTWWCTGSTTGSARGWRGSSGWQGAPAAERTEGRPGSGHGGRASADRLTARSADRRADARPLHPRRRRRLPARAHRHQRRAGADGRHLGRLDPRAHRHPPAPHRRRRTRPRPSWAPRRRAAALADAGAGPADVDAIILATPRPTRRFPATALRVQAALGVTRRLRLRPVGGLRRLHLRAVGRRQPDPRRPGARRAGDRQRGLFAHPELAGPRHLRAVRRRRRRGVPARRRGHGPAPIAASCPPICTRRARWATSCMSTARWASRTSPGHLVMNGQRGVPPRRDPAGRGGGRGAGRQRADPARRRLAGAAPGQPAHHRRDGQAARACRRSGWW